MERMEILAGLRSLYRRNREAVELGSSALKYDCDVLEAAVQYLSEKPCIGPQMEGKNEPKASDLAGDDRGLLESLDALAEKLEKQVKPDPAAVALLGALNPALKAFTPSIRENGKKDLSTVKAARMRLAELLKEAQDRGV